MINSIIKMGQSYDVILIVIKKIVKEKGIDITGDRLDTCLKLYNFFNDDYLPYRLDPIIVIDIMDEMLKPVREHERYRLHEAMVRYIKNEQKDNVTAEDQDLSKAVQKDLPIIKIIKIRNQLNKNDWRKIKELIFEYLKECGTLGATVHQITSYVVEKNPNNIFKFINSKKDFDTFKNTLGMRLYKLRSENKIKYENKLWTHV